MLIDLFGGVAIGLSTAFSLTNLFYCLVGVTLGTLVGVIPGIGTLAAISMLFPVTFHLDPTAALIMLGGIYYGTAYGGSTASILLNLPGTPASAITCLDGYPMARQGRAGVALLMTAVGSFVGGSIGILILMLFSPIIVNVAFSFRSPEYFALMLMGLVAASTISTGSPAKGIAMVLVGILIGIAGVDMYTGAARFTFGRPELMEGVSLVALAMGLFGVTEVVASIRSVRTGEVNKGITMRSMMPTREDLRRSWLPMLRGSGIGAFFGTLPGTGGSIASFMSYAVEKKVAADPSRFGNGAIEGVVGPETANNASDQTAFIPTLTLGIPGTASMALILGVLLIHGIPPGPTLMTDRPDLFWGLVMSFWIGNVLLVILNLPMIGVWVRVLMIPYRILFPSVLMFVCIGVFSVEGSVFHVLAVAVIGALGYAIRVLDFPAPPLLLGFVLGPMMEENVRRSMLLSRGSLDIFVTRPICLALMLITLGLLLWGVWNAYSTGRLEREAAAARARSDN